MQSDTHVVGWRGYTLAGFGHLELLSFCSEIAKVVCASWVGRCNFLRCVFGQIWSDLCENFVAPRCGHNAGRLRGAAGRVRWVFASCGALLAECAALRADVQNFFLSFGPKKRPSGVRLMPFMGTRCYSSVGWSVRLITVRFAARARRGGKESRLV